MSTTTQPQAISKAPPTKEAGQRMTIRKLFEQQRPELEHLLPKSMSLDRFFRLALTECVKNPKLLECTPASWALALQVCAAQRLWPDSTLGHMYLIPRKNRKKEGKPMEVTAQRGYQGDLVLARRSGEISDVWADVAYAKDLYKVTKGLVRNIEHVPSEEEDRGALRACYAVAKLKDGTVTFVDLNKADVMRHRDRSESADGEYSPWKTDEAEMWKKTAIHALSKWLPRETEEAQEAVRILQGGPLLPPVELDMPMLDAAPETPTTPEELKAKLSAEQKPKPEPHQHPDPASLAAGTTFVCQVQGCGEEIVGTCAHKSIESKLAFTPTTKLLVCPDCNAEVRGTLPEREAGAEGPDDDPAPADVAAVKGLAQAAVEQPARKSGREPLKEK